MEEKKEPIESIEQTIENLKKRIQEITTEELRKEQDKKILSISDFKLTEAELNKIKSASKEVIHESITFLKEKKEIIANSENVENTIAFIKENALKAVAVAKDVSKNEKILDTFSNVKNTAVHTMNEALSPETREKLRSTIAEAGEKLVEVSTDMKEKALESLQDEMAKAEVKEKIDVLKSKTMDAVDKVIEISQNILNKKS